MRKIFSSFRITFAYAKDIITAYICDIRNFFHYGRDIPKKFELVWCNPADIKQSTVYFIPVEGGYLRQGGELNVATLRLQYQQFIAGGDWDGDTVGIDDVSIVHRTKSRYEKGGSWQSVGEIDWMMKNIKRFGVQDGCFNLEDVLERCDRLDELFSSLEREDVFLTQRELKGCAFREYGGIGIGVSRLGELIWMKGGAHRLAISQYLGLEEIPICLQIVHEDAMENGLVYRNCSKLPLSRIELNRT